MFEKIKLTRVLANWQIHPRDDEFSVSVQVVQVVMFVVEIPRKISSSADEKNLSVVVLSIVVVLLPISYVSQVLLLDFVRFPVVV